VLLPRRSRARDQSEVVGRVEALRALVLAAAGEAPPPGEPPFSPRERELVALPPAERDPQRVVDAIWRGEALGVLAWALGLRNELPAYDEPFDHVALARGLELAGARLREADELEDAREAARLWHWRARTALLHEQGALELPDRWRSYDQLVAAAAMRGFEQGLLPAPRRGDFSALGTTYRQLDAAQRSLLHSIAAERHYALVWLCGETPWDEVVTDT
jgi:hypothetical protein